MPKTKNAEQRHTFISLRLDTNHPHTETRTFSKTFLLSLSILQYIFFYCYQKERKKKKQTKTFLYARCIEILNSVLYTLTPVKCVVCKFVRDQFPKCRISLWFGGENETHMFNNSNNYISLFLLLITLFFSFP